MAEEINKEQLVQEVLGEVKDASTGIEDLNTVSSLTGVKSLPAMKGDELVNVPVSLLSKPAEDAAKKAEESAKKAEDAVAGLEEKTQAAEKAATAATEATTKAENAANLVESTTSFALKGATARFSAIVDDATVESQTSVQTGGHIMYVRSAGVFAYAVGGKYYNNWNVEGVPSPGMYMNGDRTGILRDKLYLLGYSVYTATDGKLTLLAHRHEILTEEAFEALGDKDATTIYMTYEEE